MIRRRRPRSARSSTLIAIAVTFRDGLRFAPDAIGAFGDAVTLYQNKYPEKSMAAAQANVALFRWPLTDTRMNEFDARIQATNELAERSPGFIWRYADTYEPAGRPEPFNDPLSFSICPSGRT